MVNLIGMRGYLLIDVRTLKHKKSVENVQNVNGKMINLDLFRERFLIVVRIVRIQI